MAPYIFQWPKLAEVWKGRPDEMPWNFGVDLSSRRARLWPSSDWPAERGALPRQNVTRSNVRSSRFSSIGKPTKEI